MNVKIERLNSTFVKEISYIIELEIKDDDIQFVTITDCDITSDLSFAKIYFTVLDQNKKDVTLKALNGAAGFIRTELAQRVDIRHTPELKFFYDESIEYGKHIENIIDKINQED